MVGAVAHPFAGNDIYVYYGQEQTQRKRLEPLREPPANHSQQFARLLHLALVAPEAREVDGAPYLK
jgi:hypothetical protein